MPSSLRRRLALGVVAALMLVGTATAAQAGPRQPAKSQEIGVAALSTCDGGAQKQSLVTTQTSAATIEESRVAQPLPGAAREFEINNNEQVRILFAGEAVLFGAPFETGRRDDAISVEIRLDGTALPGIGDLTFNSGAAGSNATLVCARVPAGRHTVQVFWQLFDTSSDSELAGRLDDWALDVQINE